MTLYILRKLLGALLTLLVLTAVIFFVLQRLVPGSEAGMLAGGTAATPAAVHAIEVKLGLNQPLPVQYFHWLRNLLRGNLGTSEISGLSVSSVIAQEAPVSIELGAMVLFIATIIGIPLGVFSAVNARRRWDGFIRVPFLILYGMPTFVVGSLLLLFGALEAPWSFSASYTSLTTNFVLNMQSLGLPALAVGLPLAALLMQMTRVAFLDILEEPYINTARACGIKRRRLYYVHALKAALSPILALEGFTFGVVIGSLVVVEDLFSLPGLGQGLITSFGNHDFVELEAQTLVLAATFIVGNLVVDLLIPMIDKRLLAER
jgi:peptide/nickel transport system permease protein